MMIQWAGGRRRSAPRWAAQFVAANLEYLSVADNAALSPVAPGDMSWAFWGRIETDADMFFFAKAADAAGTMGYGFYHEPTTRLLRGYFRSAGGNSQFTIMQLNGSNFVISSGAWFFCAARYISATGAIGNSINGGTITTATTGGTFIGGLRDSTEALTVGRRSGTFHNSLTGQVSRLGIWKRALNDTELTTTLYNGGAGLWSENLDAALLTDCVAYWDLDEYSAGTGAVTRSDAVGTNHLTDNNNVPSALIA